MPLGTHIRRPSRSSIVLRSRLRDLTARMRTNQVVQRMGKWFDTLQTDLRGAANQRLHEAGSIANRVARQLLAPATAGPRPIVNATGILNLPGADLPLAEQAVDEVALVARDYRTCAPFRSGAAGSREPGNREPGNSASGSSAVGNSAAVNSAAGNSAGATAEAAMRSVETLVMEYTGAEAAVVLANSGAALSATLAALVHDRQVVVARSHVERLHGEFTLASAADLARCQLKEVGSTHRALLADYRRAISPYTGLLLYSRPAEFEISGAVALPTLDELVSLAAERRIPLVVHLPVASFVPLSFGSMGRLPVVGESIVAGADLVVFRGDTCLGGPASAIVAGRRELVERIAAEPLSAVLAADPLTLAALAATLRLHATPETALRSIPLAQLLAASSDHLKHRAERLAPQIRHAQSVGRVEVQPGQAWLSAARLPDERLASWCLRIEPRGTSAARLASDLAGRVPAVWTEVADNCLSINLRTVLPRQDEQIVSAFQNLGLRAAPGNGAGSHSAGLQGAGLQGAGLQGAGSQGAGSPDAGSQIAGSRGVDEPMSDVLSSAE